MNDNSKSFVFYESFYEAISKLPSENQLELYNAICLYSLKGENPTNLSGVAEAIFILIKPNIDSAQKRYKANAENGKKGGRPKKKAEEEPNQNPTKTQPKPNQNLNVDVDVDKDVDVNIDDNVDVDVEKANQTVADALQQKLVECTSSTNLNAIQECLTYLDDLPYEVIELALLKTSEVNGNWKYAKKILNDWISQKIDTVAKVQAEEQNFKKKKQSKSATYEQRQHAEEDLKALYLNAYE